MTFPGDLTRETPAEGLVVWQPRKGFRYAADAFWLAGFTLEGGVPSTAIDLGTGSGIVALLLARAGVDVTGVDARPEWTDAWARTLAESSVRGRVDLRTADVRDVSGRFDLAVANPPYAAAGTGPVAPDPWKAAARTESTATLADFVRKGLTVAPRLCLVLPAEREAEAVAAAKPVDAAPTRVVRVGRRRVLLELAISRRPAGPPAATPVPTPESISEEAARQRWYPPQRG